mmetsp:Transcript_25574/g.19345  ORF Transcript_25574/g.19345 Transcript_25574/m.19345 type:complete len:210 (+) Transcript_25574:2291-2920(+)
MKAPSEKEDLNKVEEEENYEEEQFEKVDDHDPSPPDSHQRDKPEEEPKKPTEKKDTEDEVLDEEEMLDVAEHCFIRIAEMMIESGRSVRGLFTKYSVPEQFPDGTVLELMSPIAFLEAVKELGLDDLQEMEAACLLRVLTKPELENAIILNELVLIMENFGVADNYDGEDEEEEDDDYIPEGEENEEEVKLTTPAESHPQPSEKKKKKL